MSVAVDKAASVYGPMARAQPTDGTLGNNTIRRPTSASNTSEALATATLADGVTKCVWAGKWVAIKNEDLTNPVEFAFSVAAQTLVYGQTGSFAAGSAASGWRLGPGETIERVVPRDALYANWIQPAGASAATIALYVSEGPVVIR